MLNPVELAVPFARKAMEKGLLECTDTETFEIEEQLGLIAYAQTFQLLSEQYDVLAEAAQIIPHEWEQDRLPQRFDGLAFKGELTSFTTLRSPRSMGERAINSLCLTFEDVTLLPLIKSPDAGTLAQTGDQIDGVRLHVPVLSVFTIDKRAA